MQSDEGIVSSAKQIGLYRQPLVINQMSPLKRRPKQECCPESKRQKPPPRESAGLSVPQGAHGEMNGRTARKQADGKQDRNMENLFESWTREALAHIKQIGDDGDGDDCRLGRNQAIHSEPPTRGGR